MFSYNVILPLDVEEQVADIIATHGYEIISLTEKIIQDIEKDRYQKF